MPFENNFLIPEAMKRFRDWRDRQQPGSRVPRYWADQIARDPNMAGAIMVVEIVLGGSRFRMSTVPVNSVSGTDGSDHSSVGTLVGEPSIRHGYTLGSGQAQSRSVSVSVNSNIINPAQIIKNGFALTGYGEVSLELVSSDHDRRYVLIQGELAGGVRFGASRGLQESEIIDFEIVDPKSSMDVRFPLWVIDEFRFGFTPHVSAIGQRIPVVFNRFVSIPAVRIRDSPGRIFLFAHEHGWEDEAASFSKVFVNGALKTPADVDYAHTFMEATDNNGIPYSYVNFTGAAIWADGDAVHVTVQHSSNNFSIIGVIRQVCVEHTPLGTQGIDESLFSLADQKVGPLQPSVLANAASGSGDTGALNWIETGLLSNFPMISMVWGRGAYGPVVTDRRAAPVMNLVAGAGTLFDRTSLVQEVAKEDLFNEFIVRYDYDPILDVYGKVLTRGASNSAICATSRDLVGERHHVVLEGHYIGDNAELATWIINWLVDHKTLPSYLVSYEGLGRLFWELRRGDTIRFSADEFGWVEEQTTIESIEYTRGRAVLEIRVWPQFTNLGGAASNYPLAVQT